ncbi:hypothetical protein DFJ73DRAFT_473521 [Zopfochytrium polystomum]|nr:hypothetical protein DFJ73DRAFT_473521 [Zopfochytrium polystomum]
MPPSPTPPSAAAAADAVETRPGTPPAVTATPSKPKEKPASEDSISSSITPTYYSFQVKSASMKVDGADKVLLKNVSGYVKPGESLAIMGPSGAGKSTLLDILAYRKTLGVWDAETHVNGIPTQRNSFLHSSGYVSSDDVLNEELTCRETIDFYSHLRLPTSTTPSQRTSKINAIMDSLKLNDCANTRVGSILHRGLSTGERKRLNIAIELLPVKTVLFLDEPTTGLDSNTGREIVSEILEIGRARKLAVVATIHQPSYSILRQFDRLLLLTAGEVAYFGPTADAIAYFEALGYNMDGNPAEVYAEQLAVAPEEIIKAYQNSSLSQLNKKKLEEIHSGNGSIADMTAFLPDNNTSTARLNSGFIQITPWHNQIVQLMKRQVLIYSRNLIMSTSRIIGALIVGLFFAVAFHEGTQRRNQASYDTKAAMTFGMGLIVPLFCVSSITYWIERRKLYYHEVNSGMFHPLWYLITSFLIELVFLMIMMSILSVWPYFLAGWLRDNISFYYGNLMCECFAVVGYSLLCANISSTVAYANAAFTFIYYTSLIFGGYYVTDDFLEKRCGAFCTKFFNWLSYMRMYFKPTIRREFYNQELTCDDDELIKINLTQYIGQAMGDVADTYAIRVSAQNATLAAFAKSQPDAFEASVVPSIFKLGGALSATSTTGRVSANLAALNITQPPALNATVSALTTSLSTNLLTLLNASAATASAVLSGVSVVYLTTAIEENIGAFSLPISTACSYANGTAYLIAASGYTATDLNFDQRPDNLYQGISIVLAFATSVLAYIALISLKYQKK